MAAKRKPKPVEVLNPRYAGATPEMVARALLKHKPKGDVVRSPRQCGGPSDGSDKDSSADVTQ